MKECEILQIGDKSSDGRVEIVDKDRLCYLIKSSNKGAVGIRTISKKLLQEYIDLIKIHPDVSGNQARDLLCGQSDVDKFQYGYSSFLIDVARLALGYKDRIKAANSGNGAAGGCNEIYYGAPGAGKSHKVNEAVNSSTTSSNIEADFKAYLAQQQSPKQDRTLEDSTIKVYLGALKNTEVLSIASEHVGFNVASLLEVRDVNKLVDIKAEVSQTEANKTSNNRLTAVIYHYINFLKQYIPDNSNVFRTTFHPDSDYASFVGAYKPTMKYQTTPLADALNALAPDGLSIQEVADELKKALKRNAEGLEARPYHTFGIKYAKYFDEYSTKEIIERAGGGESFRTELDKCKAIYKELVGVPMKTGHITYSFVPQAFTNAYVKAWQLNNNEKPAPVYLVIEEINRGNCAQIFGDIFQLLDRDNAGVSKYPIKADNDLRQYLESVLGKGAAGIKNGELLLPSNLHIIATMNTSDQSLFPMDSAFKRRWEQKYIPIDYEDASKAKLVLEISKDGSENKEVVEVDWGEALKTLNSYIKKETGSPNKMIGNRFIDFDKFPDRKISYSTFRDKVLFYLFSDVFKDNDSFAQDFFGEDFGEEGKMFFEDLCEDDNQNYTAKLLKVQ